MQQPGRDGRGGNNSTRSMNGGFPAFPQFPAFPDPFAGFGGRPGFMRDMFGNDPFFGDPFFTQPFGTPFGAGGLFGPSSIFNQGLFGMGQGNVIDQRPFSNGVGQRQANILDQRPFSNGVGQRQANILDQRPYHSPREVNRRTIQVEEGGRRGVHIEELPDDHDIVGNGQPSSTQEPIVEHPDDDEKTDNFRLQPRNPARHHFRGSSQSGNNPIRSYSFHSSSVIYGGANGPYYSSQTTRRQGPDGVIEEEHEEKDTTSGRETHRISHGLADKGHSLTRKRNAEGQEQKLQTLYNLGEEELQDFERSWETAAEKNLPKWNKNSSQRLGSSSNARPALPSSRSSRSNGR